MEEGVVRLKGIFNTREVTKALSDLKNKVKYAFRGMDAKQLSNSLKEVNSDIRKTETEATKAKAALKKLLEGQIDTAEYKQLSKDIKQIEGDINKAQAKMDKFLSGEKTPQSVVELQKEMDSLLISLQKADQEALQFATAVKEVKLGPDLNVEAAKKLDAELGNLTARWQQLSNAERSYYAELESLPTTASGQFDISKMTSEQRQVHTEWIRIRGEMRGIEDSLEKMKMNPELLAQGQELQQRIEKIDNELMVTGERLSSLTTNPELTPEAQVYKNEIDNLNEKLTVCKERAQAIKQNPELTPEAQKYTEAIEKSTAKVEELKDKQADLNKEVARNKTINEQSSKSIVAGLNRIEGRITRLAKRVLFFSVITLGLRKFRKLVVAATKSDSELSASLAQVKGNLAAAFGSIWLSVLPALRALINALAIATKYLAAFISWITGKSLKQGVNAYKAMSESSEDTAKNTKKVGKAAKKAAKDAQRLLMPFDQMNVLSKDTQETAADTDVGLGDEGAGDAGVGMEYPTDNLDKLIARFEKLKWLIAAIGIAFAAWKLAPIIASLMKISKIRAFAGVALILAGILLMINAIQKIRKEGPNFANVCQLIAGALLVVAGVLVLMGSPWALFVGAIAALLLIFGKLYKTSPEFKKFVDGIIKKIKEAALKVWKYIKDAIKKIKKAFKEKGFAGGMLEIGKQLMWGILKGIWYVIKGIGRWIKKHVVDPIIKWFKKKFGIASPAKETMPIGEMIMKGVLEGMLSPLKGIGSWIKRKVLNPIKKALFGDGENKEGFLVKIGTKFTDTKEGIKKQWTELTSDVKDKTAEMKADIKQKWKDIKRKWESLTTNVKNKTVNMKAKVPQTWNNIKTSWTNLTKNVKQKVVDMKARVKQRWENIKAGWNNLTKNVKNKTADMKARVASKWSDLKTTWNNLMSNFKDKTASIKLKIGTTIDSAKDFVNNIIEKLNGKLGALRWPKWVPGIGGNYVFDSWDPVPYLAKGAVIPPNKQFLAMLGDQKHGTNIETPLATMIDAFNTALAQNGVGGVTEVNVYLQGDAKQLFKVVRTEANNYVQSTGKAAFNL